MSAVNLSNLPGDLKADIDRYAKHILETFIFYYEYGLKATAYHNLVRSIAALKSPKTKSRKGDEAILELFTDPSEPYPSIMLQHYSAAQPHEIFHQGYHLREEKMLGILSNQYSPPLPERSAGHMKKRYFVVNHDYTVDVYKSQEDYNRKKPPKGARFSLITYVLHPDANLAVSERSEEISRHFPVQHHFQQFNLPTIELESGSNKRAYYFAFETPEEHEAWSRVYQHCIDNAWRVARSTAMTSEQAVQHSVFTTALRWTRTHCNFWKFYGGQSVDYATALLELATHYSESELYLSVDRRVKLFGDGLTSSNRKELQKYVAIAMTESIPNSVQTFLAALWKGPKSLPTHPEGTHLPKAIDAYTSLTTRVEELVLLKVQSLQPETVTAMLKKGIDEKIRALRGHLLGAFTSFLSRLQNLSDGKNAELWFYTCLDDIAKAQPFNYLERVRCVFRTGFHPGDVGGDEGNPATVLFECLIQLAVAIQSTMRGEIVLLQGCGKGGGLPYENVMEEVTDLVIGFLRNALFTVQSNHDREGFSLKELTQRLDLEATLLCRRISAFVLDAVLLPAVVRAVLDLVHGSEKISVSSFALPEDTERNVEALSELFSPEHIVTYTVHLAFRRVITQAVLGVYP